MEIIAKKKTSTPRLIALAGLVFALGLGGAGIYLATRQTQDEDPTANNDSSLFGEVETSGIALRGVREAINNEGQATVRIGYKFEPVTATYQDVTITLAWASSTFTEDINQYLKFDANESTQVITLTKLKDFPKSAQLKIVSKADAGVFLTIAIENYERLENVEAGTEISASFGDWGVGEVSAREEVNLGVTASNPDAYDAGKLNMKSIKVTRSAVWSKTDLKYVADDLDVAKANLSYDLSAYANRDMTGSSRLLSAYLRAVKEVQFSYSSGVKILKMADYKEAVLADLKEMLPALQQEVAKTLPFIRLDLKWTQIAGMTSDKADSRMVVAKPMHLYFGYLAEDLNFYTETTGISAPGGTEVDF